MRDIFGPQQAAKQQHRPSQWTCGFCGKSFFEERHLDLHFDNRHKNEINVAEDAVCLADYCAMMRCEVLVARDALGGPSSGQRATTDIEIWRDAGPRGSSRPSATALTATGPRALARLPHGAKANGRNGRYKNGLPGRVAVKRCDRDEAPVAEDVDNDDGEVEDIEENGDSNATAACDEHLVDSALPAVDGSTNDEFQRLKADCKPDDLARLKLRCEILVRDCIAGLLVHLSVQDFTDMEEELNHAVCWYLSCDRYWEEGNPEPRPFPWGLLFVMVMVLSLGICLCYYIIWVLFEITITIFLPKLPSHDDRSVASTSATATAHSSPSHSAAGRALPGEGDGYGQRALVARDPSLGADPGAADMGQSEHYIYVTYPPDLKRRLLERYAGGKMGLLLLGVSPDTERRAY
ncbi:uncharacterized protein LOC113373717 [Ctenocephalides felis]|uniref:uncharacterized protein LOC113373717 n=1 Tax=Ctenocephalides felis TaxID=7515 RepID=UPI000E6E12CC|nr:uncharacterized protein LOC113373717 [Ctenocephalides felis]